ncbi:MAG: hypothetical protein ACKVVP_18400 [Chloroflexota bacterium]
MADEAQASTGMSREELEARVIALEAELRRKDQEQQRDRNEAGSKESRSERSSTVESTRELVDKTNDEARRLVRAVTLAQVEGLRTFADALGTFADEFSRRRQDDKDSPWGLPSDLYSAHLKAVETALEIPERASEAFRENYRTKDEKQTEDKL